MVLLGDYNHPIELDLRTLVELLKEFRFIPPDLTDPKQASACKAISGYMVAVGAI